MTWRALALVLVVVLLGAGAGGYFLGRSSVKCGAAQPTTDDTTMVRLKEERIAWELMARQVSERNAQLRSALDSAYSMLGTDEQDLKDAAETLDGSSLDVLGDILFRGVPGIEFKVDTSAR